MDRDNPTEAVLSEMRDPETPVYYPVGTPKRRLSHYEGKLLMKLGAAKKEAGRAYSKV